MPYFLECLSFTPTTFKRCFQLQTKPWTVRTEKYNTGYLQLNTPVKHRYIRGVQRRKTFQLLTWRCHSCGVEYAKLSDKCVTDSLWVLEVPESCSCGSLQELEWRKNASIKGCTLILNVTQHMGHPAQMEEALGENTSVLRASVCYIKMLCAAVRGSKWNDPIQVQTKF